ncbi:MAG: hypothetical protein JWP63_3599 [Candidatus Solibacter sp.]|jgi:hypothetical protein|nr:hypothetical protein [Candidatus Solibacter sp.]
MRPSAIVLLVWTVAAQTVDPNAKALEDYQKRIAEYMKVHDKARSGVGKLKTTESPERIAKYEKEMAHKIHEAREHVTQGNIFTPEIAAALHHWTDEATKGEDKTTVHQSLRRSEPVVVELKVNRAYPKGVPLQTMPPSLLQNLPKLPPDLEYRVVGHALVLRDSGANLIVDYLPNLIP